MRVRDVEKYFLKGDRMESKHNIGAERKCKIRLVYGIISGRPTVAMSFVGARARRGAARRAPQASAQEKGRV